MLVRSESAITSVTTSSLTKSRRIPNAPMLRLTRHPSLSGDPFDASDDFADFSQSPSTSSSLKNCYSITSPVTPSHSVLTSTPSTTTISSCDTWNTPGSTLWPTVPPTPLQQLQAQVHLLTSIINAPQTVRALNHIHRLRPRIPMSTLLAEHVIPAVCNALSTHISSNSVCEKACRFLSIVASTSRNARRIALQNSALQLVNDAIVHHFLIYPTTIQVALHAIGSLCLNGSSLVTLTLLSNRIFHWIFVAMRQWHDVPLIQTHSFRVFAICTKMDFEIAFHLVLSHAVFHEFISTLSTFSHDPFLVSNVFQTMLSFIRPSSEFRRLSLCEDVFLNCAKAVSAHCTESRVNHAFASIVSAYCIDQDTHLLVQQQGGVKALLEGLANICVPDSRQKPPELSAPLAFLDITLHEGGNVTEEMGSGKGVGNGQKTKDTVDVGDRDHLGGCSDESDEDIMAIFPISALDATLASFQALAAVCTDCDKACDEVLRRSNMTIIANAATLHSNDSNVILHCLTLFTLLLKLPSMENSVRATASLTPLTEILPERAMRTTALDVIIRIAGITLYGHSSHRPAVALACSLLLFTCQNGFRKVVLKRISHIVCAIEKILQACVDDDALKSAFTLLMIVR